MSVRMSCEPLIPRRTALPTLELLRRLRCPWPPLVGLVLDCGGVLYDDTVWLRWLLKLLTRIGLHAQFAPFMRIWQREYLVRVKTGEVDYWQALQLFLRALGLTSGQTAEVLAAAKARRRELEASLLPLPGIISVLTRLRSQGVRLTVLSSGHTGAAEVQRQLARAGLDGLFDLVLAEIDIVAASPHQSALEPVIALIDLPVRQLAYLGRDAQMLQLAGAAGLRTVAVNYDGDAEADVYIEHAEQLLDLLPWCTPQALAG